MPARPLFECCDAHDWEVSGHLARWSETPHSPTYESSQNSITSCERRDASRCIPIRFSSRPSARDCRARCLDHLLLNRHRANNIGQLQPPGSVWLQPLLGRILPEILVLREYLAEKSPGA